MCLGVPARVIKIYSRDGMRIAVVDFEGIEAEVDATFIENLKEGDYVIVHAGIAIEKLDPKEAEESIRIWREMLEVLSEELRSR